MRYIAHVRARDNTEQSLQDHLNSVADLCGQLADKIGESSAGELIGLMHDFGKYSQAFQIYIKTATDIDRDDTDEEWVASQKGKIDHSTAGAQWVWHALQKFGRERGQGELCGQILALCIASHHSGLIDCFDAHAEDTFAFRRRMNKPDDWTHLQECMTSADQDLLNRAQNLAQKNTISEVLQPLKVSIQKISQHQQETIHRFYLGHFTRFLFSCLIDADRTDSADFEFPSNQRHRNLRTVPDWATAIDRLEKYLAARPIVHPIDQTRRDISDACHQRAHDPQGIYTLSVPTGGGKTLASLRYALHHAQHHQLERIIFIIPYTSIIDQNAEVVRSILGQQANGLDWVLEHHSNLEPERQTWLSKLISDNWDAPIVFTTMVQYLEANFGGGTRSVRRLHQIASSVLVFDEIQTLPLKCVHLFANSLNFFKQHTHTTCVLCTATQPLLHQIDPALGSVELSEHSELMGRVDSVQQLFDELERVEVQPLIRDQGWSLDELTELILTQFAQTQSVLVIVNTKAWAQQLYQACRSQDVDADALFHLSTNQCPAHRKALLDGDPTTDRLGIRQRLAAQQPVLCISTQLIEAGVDISAAVVIRFLAGLDSIAQAAGRCNRHGERSGKGQVLVVNPAPENLDKLPDIKIGREVAARIFGEIKSGALNCSPLSPQAMNRYFNYYFFQRKNEMLYHVKQEDGADNILNLLTKNSKKTVIPRIAPQLPLLTQSFKQAGAAFKAIDAPTQAIVVPYGHGAELITELYALKPDWPDFYTRLAKLQREAQKFSVNVFPNVWTQLVDANAVTPVFDTGIYTLDERYYSSEFGLSVEADGKMENLFF